LRTVEFDFNACSTRIRWPCRSASRGLLIARGAAIFTTGG